MKLYDIELSPDIKTIINERRKRILFAMYILYASILSVDILKDFLYNNIYDFLLESSSLLFIIISFLLTYKKNKHDIASYLIIFISGLTTIFTIIINKFNDYTPIFIIPVTIAIIFLFSWKKGILLNALLYIILLFVYYLNKDYIASSLFIQNSSAVVNFLIVTFIIFVFTYFYETTRVDAYKLLLISNQKKDLLYHEIHHRVKNNLNIVISMLSLQAKKENKDIQNIIEISKQRINSMAMIHSILYVSKDLERVNSKIFIKKLTNSLQNMIDKKIEITQKIENIELSLNEIMPIGFILNELLTNSFKYAFLSEKNPKIKIILKIRNNKILLTYFDNGSGYKKNYEKSIGLNLVALNIKQLKGKLKIKRNKGLTYNIKYERNKNAQYINS